MKQFLLSFLVGCSAAVGGYAQTVPQIIESVRKQYAPDRRVAIFQVEPDSAGRLVGKTNLPEARQALTDRLRAAQLPSATDGIQVLPAPALGEQTYAVVTVSVANLRSNPRDAAELATQALLGMPLKVWEKDRGWYLVQTPDQYIAWADFGGIQRMTKTDFDHWQGAEKVVYTRPFGFCYSRPDDDSPTVSDLVAGDMLVLINEQKHHYHVRYPDGRTGFVVKKEARLYDHWLADRKPSETTLVNTARSLMGIPYLWGGTSVKGMDCSGFTKTVYMLNGLPLPRDASQQVEVGELVETPGKTFINLKPGDLLFFGQAATADKSERVVHVGMWIGNNSFIHASGQVRVSSLDPQAPNFDAYELNRFLRAKRILKEPQ